MKRLVEAAPAIGLLLLWRIIEDGGFDEPVVLAWIAATVGVMLGPLLLRPLTYHGRSPRDRLLVASCLGTAAFCWCFWLWPGGSFYYGKIGGVSLLATFAALVAAIYIRMGWGPLNPIGELRGIARTLSPRSVGRTLKYYLTMRV